MPDAKTSSNADFDANRFFAAAHLLRQEHTVDERRELLDKLAEEFHLGAASISSERGKRSRSASSSDKSGRASSTGSPMPVSSERAPHRHSQEITFANMRQFGEASASSRAVRAPAPMPFAFAAAPPARAMRYPGFAPVPAAEHMVQSWPVRHAGAPAARFGARGYLVDSGSRGLPQPFYGGAQINSTRMRDRPKQHRFHKARHGRSIISAASAMSNLTDEMVYL